MDRLSTASLIVLVAAVVMFAIIKLGDSDVDIVQGSDALRVESIPSITFAPRPNLPATPESRVVRPATESESIPALPTPTPAPVELPHLPEELGKAQVGPFAAETESGSVGETELIRQIIADVFGANAKAATAVARCESKLDPNAIGPIYGERGIFQIRPELHYPANPQLLFDPTFNARLAAAISNGGTDWSQWTCGWAARTVS